MQDGQYTEDDLDNVFRTGKIYDAPEPDLWRYLQVLCFGHLPNDAVHPRAIVRGMAINSILTFRFTERIQKSARYWTFVSVALTVVIVTLTTVSLCQSCAWARQSTEVMDKMDRVIQLQEEILLPGVEKTE